MSDKGNASRLKEMGFGSGNGCWLNEMGVPFKASFQGILSRGQGGPYMKKISKKLRFSFKMVQDGSPEAKNQYSGVFSHADLKFDSAR